MKTKRYDVVVVGGGIGGIAAAVAAARRGCRTALIEKLFVPGGLATSGLVYIYLPICDGYGTQVSKSLAEELLYRSFVYGPGTVDERWRERKGGDGDIRRFRCVFSPAACMLGWEAVLDEAGVDVWYDSLVCGVRMERRRVTAVEVENMSGRVAVAGKVFVDASGSCVVARLAGAPVLSANNSQTIWAIDYQQGVKARAGYELGDNLDMHYISSLPPEYR